MNEYLKEKEAEERLLRAQVKRLCQENAWLREQAENGPAEPPADVQNLDEDDNKSEVLLSVFPRVT